MQTGMCGTTKAKHQSISPRFLQETAGITAVATLQCIPCAATKGRKAQICPFEPGGTSEARRPDKFGILGASCPGLTASANNSKTSFSPDFVRLNLAVDFTFFALFSRTPSDPGGGAAAFSRSYWPRAREYHNFFAKNGQKRTFHQDFAV
jgi:hypothetical protein